MSKFYHKNPCNLGLLLRTFYVGNICFVPLGASWTSSSIFRRLISKRCTKDLLRGYLMFPFPQVCELDIIFNFEKACFINTKDLLRGYLMVPFPQVCELDIIFNFEKAYFMLDELVLGGEVCETSKKNVLKAIAAQDLLQEVCIA